MGLDIDLSDVKNHAVAVIYTTKLKCFVVYFATMIIYHM